jgi:hypothetical protein
MRKTGPVHQMMSLSLGPPGERKTPWSVSPGNPWHTPSETVNPMFQLAPTVNFAASNNIKGPTDKNCGTAYFQRNATVILLSPQVCGVE